MQQCDIAHVLVFTAEKGHEGNFNKVTVEQVEVSIMLYSASDGSPTHN